MLIHLRGSPWLPLPRRAAAFISERFFIFVAVAGDWWVLLTFDGIIDGHVHVQNGQIETRKKEKGQ